MAVPVPLTSLTIIGKRAVIATIASPKVTVLLLDGAPAIEDVDFLNNQYFGEDVEVTTAERRGEPILDAIKAQAEQVSADFLIVGRFDSGDSTEEIYHILTGLSDHGLCPSLYVSTQGTRAELSSPSNTDATEMTDLTHGDADVEDGSGEGEADGDGEGADGDADQREPATETEEGMTDVEGGSSSSSEKN